jgi:hypothetical protein
LGDRKKLKTIYQNLFCGKIVISASVVTVIETSFAIKKGQILVSLSGMVKTPRLQAKQIFYCRPPYNFMGG